MGVFLKNYFCTYVFGFLIMATAAGWAQSPPSGNALSSNPIFQNNCSKCHGKSAEGHWYGGPSLVASKVAAESKEELLNMISNGKGHMPKYAGKLSPEEINTLVQQIKAMNQK
jgi:mono/diheme cytochrome c family protein